MAGAAGMVVRELDSNKPAGQAVASGLEEEVFREGGEMTDQNPKTRIPRPKGQDPGKIQDPSTYWDKAGRLDLDVWIFSGSWSLELGSSLDLGAWSSKIQRRSKHQDPS